MTLLTVPHDLVVRDIRPEDAELLQAFHAGLSAATTYRRFFAPHPFLLPDEITRFTCVDGSDRVALVVLDDGSIIAVARYDRHPERHDEAEVAFAVADERQGAGLGTRLLKSLVDRARRNGIRRLTAETLANNREMMAVFRHSGFDLTVNYDHGVALVEFGITPE